MSETLTVTQMVRHFAEYVNRVAYRQESFVLVRGNKAIAELRPLPSGKRLAELPGLFASLPRLSADEASSFADDLDSARDEFGRMEERDAWGS